MSVGNLFGVHGYRPNEVGRRAVLRQAVGKCFHGGVDHRRRGHTPPAANRMRGVVVRVKPKLWPLGHHQFVILPDAPERTESWPPILIGGPRNFIHWLRMYDRWLHCQTLARTFNPQHWNRLAQQFAEIIAAAPQFAPAYCGLADMHTIEHIAHPGVFRAAEREQKALELGRKAVQLDPVDTHTHASPGHTR